MMRKISTRTFAIAIAAVAFSSVMLLAGCQTDGQAMEQGSMDKQPAKQHNQVDSYTTEH